MAFPNDQVRKVSLTIAASKVAGSAAHTNFPLLITQNDLPNEVLDSDGSTAPQSDGDDIRFSSDSAGSTELAFEIVHYTQDSNPANATAEIWVKIPSLDDAVDTVIYMWWGNASISGYAVTDPFGRNAVWSDYEFVAHDGGATDSSGNQTISTTGTPTNATNHLGISNTAKSFSAGVAEGYDYVPASPDIGAQNISLLVWANKAATNQQNGRFLQLSHSTGGVIMLIANSTANDNFTITTAPGSEVTTDDDIQQNFGNSTWQMIHGVSLASGGEPVSSELYIAGASTGTPSGGGFAEGTDNNSVTIGYRNDGSTAADYEGLLSEVRIRYSRTIADWITTEYNNQLDAADMITAGTPEATRKRVFVT